MDKYVKLSDLMEYPIRLNHYDKKHGNKHFVLGIESVLEYAEYLATSDVKEVKHGRWNDGVCTNCGFDALYYERGTAQVYTDYCPNCGCKMDGGS